MVVRQLLNATCLYRLSLHGSDAIVLLIAPLSGLSLAGNSVFDLHAA